MATTWQFVDSITANPTVRLDLNTLAGVSTCVPAGGGMFVTDVQPELSPPELRRVTVSSMLAHGDAIPASSFANRVIKLPIYVAQTSADLQATLLQSLARELARQPGNILRVQMGTSNPLFFRTFPAPDAAYQALMYQPNKAHITLQIPCEPFGYGLEETLGYGLLNSNVTIESGVSPWTGQNCTVVQSTDYSRSGTHSLKLTPTSGTPVAARSETFTLPATYPIVPNALHTAAGWMYSPTGWASGASIAVDWLDQFGATITTTFGAVSALTANVWTQLTLTTPAVPGAVTANFRIRMAGSPTPTDITYADDLTFTSGLIIYNDPNEGVTRNSNPYFEFDASSWTVTGGTFARSTAQFHEGAASGLLTPSGSANSVFVESDEMTVALGQMVRGSAWLRNAVARNVQLRVNWYDTGHVFSSQSTLQSTSVLANTWTYFDAIANAPIAGFARLTPFMAGTPVSGSNLLNVDQARIRLAGDVGGMCIDLNNVKGDVDTPLLLLVSGSVDTGGSGNLGQKQSGVAVRRGGSPAAMPFDLQAESMTQGTNTTTQAYSSSMSGTGNNYSRCTFGSPSMLDRLTITKFPLMPSNDARGTYAVYARVRQSVGTDVIAVRLLWGSPTVQITGPTVTLPTDVGPSAPTIKYVNMGVRLQIPIGYDPVYDGLSNVELLADGLYVSFQAQRVLGTGNLDVDLLLFWPIDDCAEIVQWPAVKNSSTDAFVVVGGEEPAAYCLDVTNEIESSASPTISGTGTLLTPGIPNRVFIAEDLGVNTSASGVGDDVTASLVVAPSYYPRYLFPLKPVST